MLLRVVNLAQRYGDASIINDLSFRVERGEVVALVGRNGAGKTTALRTVVGLERPAAGEVLFDGEPLDERDPEVRRRLCTLLDDGAWFPDLTVAEHLMVYASAHGEPPDAYLTALDELGIEPLADRLPTTLSSGQTQRVKLAQALVRPWDLLILDEPEQRLDTDGRDWLARYLTARTAEGRAVLMASHDADLRAACAARVVAVSSAQ